jgi:uncharacterized protein (TIGR03085 family)
MGSIRWVTHFAPIERSALADLMGSLGPDAPTLCEGWTTRDLAAHLVVRLTRIDAAPGIVIRPLAPYLSRVQDKTARQSWPDLVAQVRRLPRWLRPIDEAMNRVEYFVHHEDVRRAQPGWQPRELSPELAEALWSRVRTQARLALRRTPATVTLTAPGFGSVPAGRGGPRVDLFGAPGELLLFLMGRQDHTMVELAGPDELTDRMRAARYGV